MHNIGCYILFIYSTNKYDNKYEIILHHLLYFNKNRLLDMYEKNRHEETRAFIMDNIKNVEIPCLFE